MSLELLGRCPPGLGCRHCNARAPARRERTDRSALCCGALQVRRQAPLASLKEVAMSVDSRSLYARPFAFDSNLDEVQVRQWACCCCCASSWGSLAGAC
jgi:hypothetical protein